MPHVLVSPGRPGYLPTITLPKTTLTSVAPTCLWMVLPKLPIAGMLSLMVPSIIVLIRMRTETVLETSICLIFLPCGPEQAREDKLPTMNAPAIIGQGTLLRTLVMFCPLAERLEMLNVQQENGQNGETKLAFFQLDYTVLRIHNKKTNRRAMKRRASMT